MIDAVRGYLAERCPWETAIGIAGVQRAEDVRWRDAVEAAEEAGEPVPAAEREWAALWCASRTTVAQVAGALVKRALETGGKDAVSACKALLPIEGGEAWQARGPEAHGSDEGGGIDEIAVERLSKEQRRRAAELADAATVLRDEMEQLMREARSVRD